MERKRSREPDEEHNSHSGKRTRHEAQHSIADSSSAMQAVAHEALAITNGASFSAINRKRVSGDPAATGAVNQAPEVTGSSSSIGISSGSGGGKGGNTEAGNGISSNSSNSIGSGCNNPSSFESMSDITRCFKNAVLKGWDRRSPTYAKVGVLLIYWDEDSADVKSPVASLEAVFRSTYHFATEMFSIQGVDAEDQLYAKIDTFFAQSSLPGDLAILFYAGQTVANRAVGEAPLWTPRNRQAPATIESKPIQAACERATCDVLLLLDFCNAYHYPLTKASYGTARRNVIEVLDAPSCDLEPGSLSFTRALTEELEAVSHNGPITVEALCTKVSNRMVVSKPRGRGRPPKEPPFKYASEQLHLPKHYWLFRSRSIVLEAQPREPQVAVCLRVLNGSIDVNQWGKWIYSAPPTARDSVQIEGLYTGFSTMIVLRVPVSEWGLFSECPAGSFVGYTTIGEIDPGIQEKIDKDLASKLWVEESNMFRSLELPSTAPSGSPVAGHAGSEVATTTQAAPPVSTVGAETSASSLAALDPATTAGGTNADSRVNDTLIEKDANGEYSLRTSEKRARKALPTERKFVASEFSPLPGRRKELPSGSSRSLHQVKDQYPAGHFQNEKSHNSSAQMVAVNDTADKLAAAAQKPSKISIKLAGQAHVCKECKTGFKDADSLHNHVRKQHTRPFHCVFNWAGCDSTFASKNEWKRHVMSQHILLQYWVCQVDLCSKVINRVGSAPKKGSKGISLPNGAIFNRKDLFTQHLRRMHTPPHVKKLLKQAKQGVKNASHPAVVEWEGRLKELQQDGLKPRCRLPDYMVCPAFGCGVEFHGGNAWDDRMEHVARHLEAASAGREPPVVFGGERDTTLTNWATQPEVAIAKKGGTNIWHLNNPLRPEAMPWLDIEADSEE